MSSRTEVLLWAKRVCARRAAEPHVALDISADAPLEVAQAAFHQIARTSHPDLFRTACTAEELELITTAFALIANAYQQYRSQRVKTTKIPALSRFDDAPIPRHGGNVIVPGKATPVSNAPVLVPDTGSTGGTAPGQQMSQRALVHYRKAELSLRRGDLTAGILHMKMAIAADPASKFLRQALAQVEAELAKKP